MKAFIEIKFLKIRNALTGKDINVDEDLSKNDLLKIAVIKNLKIICKQLEDYFKKKRIITKFSFNLEND